VSNYLCSCFVSRRGSGLPQESINRSERDLTNLSCLDDGQLAELFQQGGDDPRFLDALIVELKHRGGDAAIELRIRVVARRALVRSQASAQPRRAARPSEPVYDWLRAFLGARELPRPDERPLYRYRMEDSEYEQAKKILRHLVGAGRLIQPDDRAGALFVAYCAEWFRRESASTFLKWGRPSTRSLPIRSVC
jgi:hypothetical protein